MNQIIEREAVSGFVDHDYEKIKNFSIKGRIGWFQYRYKKILFCPIQSIKNITEKSKNSLESSHVSIFTIVMMSICVAIDLLGGFLKGRVTSTDYKGRDFKSFVRKYLDKKNEYAKCPYEDISKFSDLLYHKFRCGLAHNLAIKKCGFGYGDKYFRKEGDLYYVSVDRLFKDLKQAFYQYISDIKVKKSIRYKFNKRFKYIFIERM